MRTKKSFILAIVLSLLLLSGCQYVSAQAGTQNALNITAEYCSDTEAYTVRFSPAELHDQYDGELVYSGVKNVSILLAGQQLPLEDAISQGKTTVDELIALARKDCAAGNCTEYTETELGLTEFTYLYETPFKLALCYTNDVMELSSGKKVLVRTMQIRKFEPEKQSISYDALTPYYDESGNVRLLKTEDWGLEFSVGDITADEIVLNCVQAGGQQYGELAIAEAFLTCQDGNSLCLSADPIPIAADSSSSIRVPLTVLDSNDPVPSGSYRLVLRVCEVYNAEDLPSLMKNYTDTQYFAVDGITVP